MDDPFPPSLPTYGSPRIVNNNRKDSMGDFWQHSLAPAGDMFAEAGMMNDPTLFSSFAKFGENPTTNSTMMGPEYSLSPQSSLSSSSGSSNQQHNRGSSCASSHSGPSTDVQMTNTPGPHDIPVSADPAAGDCLFDFESASSSPLHLESQAVAKPSSTNEVEMPIRPPPNNGANTNANRPHANASREGSPSSANMQSQAGTWLPSGCNSHQMSLGFSPGNYVTGDMLCAPFQAPTWQYNNTSNQSGYANGAPSSAFSQSTNFKPYASPPLVSAHMCSPDSTGTISTGTMFSRNSTVPPFPPTIHIAPLPPKSRVETQIPIRLTLFPLPSFATKLHLPTYTISKSKLVSKPTPEKSPDMLELGTMLVCTSAMLDLAKQRRAFARAAGLRLDYYEDGGRSSGDGTSVGDAEDKPENGGPVDICIGCIERERKRAARKKTKNVEEEELWQKDEARRTIVFNCPEVKEWQQPSQSKDADGSDGAADSYGGVSSFPEDAMQVDLPMRIACYCRHHEEKVGFQVIFTIKDHQNNLVAQAITNSIIITDDHKTHAPPNTLPPQQVLFTENSQLPGAGVFAQTPIGNPGTATFTRHAFSTTDLQGLQQQHTPQHQLPDRNFVTPQQMSQTTSASLTPRSLSRQASPSAPLGQQQNKRRKANGSGRIRNDLVMTKLPTTIAPSPASTTMPTSGQSFGIGPRGIPPIETNHAFQGLSVNTHDSQFNTSPPTPGSINSGFGSSAQRSQSMENLQSVQGIFTAPNSQLPSRAPSPTSGVQSNALPQGHAQMLNTSLQSVPGAAQQLRTPVIHKLTPSEGPKSGGIEVTCLGSGFHRGLEVMFGDALATTTTYWGESALVCLVPPALRAGVVAVTFKHGHGQAYPSPRQQAYFKYIDDDEQELMKHALAIINRKMARNAVDAGEFARQVISGESGNNAFMSGSIQGTDQQRQARAWGTAVSGMVDVEAALLRCLELVDLDDSPYEADLNTRNTNGQSMLHLGASLGYYRLVAGLLARGANPDQRDNNGMSPMHTAALNGRLRILSKLRSAGGDPTMRSLNGYTPADMATKQEVRDALTVSDGRVRTRSAGPDSSSRLSRTSSVMSQRSARVAHQRNLSMGPGSVNLPDEEFSDGDDRNPYRSRPMTPAQQWNLSRRNSHGAEDYACTNVPSDDLAPGASALAANPAMSAWRDQLSAQIQQLQQSVHRVLPPIPNIPIDYQAYPVVRRISSMVPQINSPPSPAESAGRSTKGQDHHWWDLWTSVASLPPAYDEIYPAKSQQDLDDKKLSALRAAGEAVVDQKCEPAFDQAESSSIMRTVNIGSQDLTQQQREQLMAAHAKKIKKLRSDRKLFFIWLPLLFLVVLAMLKDWAPQAWHGARQAVSYIHDRFQERVVEVVV